jgi:hypothetical protein
MDKYNHWLGKLFATLFAPKGKEYAVTLGQTTYYSCSIHGVSLVWRLHEDCHKAQYRREGVLCFLTKYLYYQATRGYIDNPFEVEARKAEL